MNIGVLGTSDIAFRRFLPALKKCGDAVYAGIASRYPEKGKKFAQTFGGAIYPSYNSLLEDDSIDAVYIPLPPALHYEWGEKTLEAGKHILMEKPFATNLKEAEALLNLAEKKRLAAHENYMFLYHSQMARAKEIISDGTLGEIRLYRISFGFPKRKEDDFRYRKALGGGALLDCGGYPVRLATELMGKGVRVAQANLARPRGYEVDLFGSAVLRDENGLCAQLSFGMDNSYQCRLEAWGSKATLIATRIFTAGADFSPAFTLRTSTDETTLRLPEDDQFLHSIETFLECVKSDNKRLKQYRRILAQAELTDKIRRMDDAKGDV